MRAQQPGGATTGRRAGGCRLVAAVVASLLFAAAPCAPSFAAVRATGDDGVVLTLERPARRIISLAPHVTELLFAAGAGDRIVGTIRYSDHPPAALRIPRIGDSFSVDSEVVLGLKPDLLIVWLHGNPEAQLDKLRRLGVPVFSSEPRRLADIASTIRRFGTLAGTEPAAERAARAFEAGVDALRATYSQRSPVRVFYQVAERPLLTVNGRHLIDDVIRLCGGVNVFADLKPLTPEVGAEAVASADPEAIITAGGEAGNATGFALWSRLTSRTATKRMNFILLNSDTISRQSDRVLGGAKDLCAKLDAVRRRRPR
jgi:iron complex transport system substrate-binding protein